MQRGFVVLSSGVVLVFVVVSVVYGFISSLESPQNQSVCGDVWVVTHGDTLWRIAKECYPGKHTGQMVYEIRNVNPEIDPGRLRVGQKIMLP